MKTTEKGKLSVEIGKDNKASVIFNPVNNTIWMDKNDLCELFGVYMATIDTCLESIFNSKIFNIRNVCKYQLLCKRNKLVHEITAINFEVIIAMAFRIESFNAGILRNWLFKRFREPKYIDSLKLNFEQNYLLN